ncbi:flavin reductase family protein [Methylomonas sp. MgM2]
MSEAMADLFKRITVGVYVIGVTGGGRNNAFTAACVSLVSFQPLLLVLSINRMHSSYQILKSGGVFSINVLRQDQMPLAEHFGGPSSRDKLATVSWYPGKTGAPLLDDVIAHFECEMVAEYPAGDHVLALGRVVSGSLLQANAEPMVYRDTGNMDGAAALFPDRF